MLSLFLSCTPAIWKGCNVRAKWCLSKLKVRVFSTDIWKHHQQHRCPSIPVTQMRQRERWKANGTAQLIYFNLESQTLGRHIYKVYHKILTTSSWTDLVHVKQPQDTMGTCELFRWLQPYVRQFLCSSLSKPSGAVSNLVKIRKHIFEWRGTLM